MTASSERRFRATVVKLVLFAAVSVVLTTVVVATLLNIDTNGVSSYRAIFADASGLQSGDIVAIAGVQVGKVGSVSLSQDRAVVSFSVASTQQLTTTSRATVGFENLLGNRYLSISAGAAGGQPLRPGATIPETRTSGGLSLTELFDGFQPLFSALDPQQINQLTASVIAVFQGQSNALSGLLTQTADITNNLANRGQVITEVIDNLAPLLTQVSGHDAQLSSLIQGLSSFTTGLAGDRSQIAAAITSVGGLTGQLSQVLAQSRPALDQSIRGLATATGALAGDQSQIDAFLGHLTPFAATLAKVMDQGSFLSVYLCNLTLLQQGTPQVTLVPGVTGTLALPTGPVGNQSVHTSTCR